MGRARFLFTITGFWLRRMALALRMAAWGQGEGSARCPHSWALLTSRPQTAPTHHAQIWAVLVLADHVPDTAEGGPGVLVDGGPHIGGGRFPLAWGGGRGKGIAAGVSVTARSCPSAVSLGRPLSAASPIQAQPCTLRWVLSCVPDVRF